MSIFQKEILLCHIDYQIIVVYSRQDIIIYVDSQAALNALTGHLVVFTRQALEAQIIDAALGSVAYRVTATKLAMRSLDKVRQVRPY